jgi:hypothetical protein
VAIVAAGCATGSLGSDRAPDESIESQLAQTASFRASNHRDAALAALDRVLKRVNHQGGPQTLSPDTRAALNTEIVGANETVRVAVHGPLAAGQPLAAEAALARLAPFLSDALMAPYRQEAAEAIRKTGQQTCARLQGTVSSETPYWALGVSRYCAHFGTSFAPPPRATALRSFEVTGTLAGLSAEQAAVLRDSVADWLRASLWFDADGQAIGRGTIDGSYGASFKRQTVTLHAPYKQRVGVYSSSIVPPQQTYDARGVPIYNNPTSSSWGVAMVDQTFAYDAEEVRGDYTFTASVNLDVGAAAPVSLAMRRAQGIKGYQHDVTFEPGGIVPRHDDLPSARQWFQEQVAAMWGKAVWALNRKFIDAHCKRESYAPDEAVRCVVAGQQPTAALAALTQAIGEDARPLVPILQPPPPPKPEAPAKIPTRARKAQSGAVDDEDPVIE